MIEGKTQPTLAQGFTLHWPFRNLEKYYIGTFQALNDTQLVLIMDGTTKQAGQEKVKAQSATLAEP